MEISPSERINLHPDEVFPCWALYGFQLAPDGSRFSFIHQHERRVDEITEKDTTKLRTKSFANIHFLASQGGYPQPLTASGNFAHPPVWSPDGKWLALEHDGKLKIMAVDGSQARWIYKGSLYYPPAVDENSAAELSDAQLGFPRWLPNGQSILIAIQEEYTTILRQLSADGTWQRDLFSCEGTIMAWDISPDGRSVLLTTRSEDGWSGAIICVEIENSAAQTLCQEDQIEYRAPVACWAAQGQIVLRSNRSGWSKLWVISTAGSPARPLTSGEWDDTSFCLSPDGNFVVYASHQDQSGLGDDLWIVPISGGQPQRLTSNPGTHTPFAWSAAEEIFFWRSSPSEPGELWSLPSQGGEQRRLTWSLPLDTARKLPPAQSIVIPNQESSAPVPALLYLPVNYQEGQRFPAIVWIHGGPTMAARFDYNRYCSWLANLGYVVIFPFYRGSAGLGINFMNAVSGDGLGKNDLSDVLAAGRYVRSLPIVDASRGIGVGGGSWGGYLTLMAITQAPDLFSCAYAGAAISDWFIQQAHTEVRYYDRWLVGGWIYEHPERARARSPITFAERLKIPLLVLHGERDTSVPISQMRAFVEKARQNGAEIEFVTYPHEGHMFRKPENQQDALKHIQSFFQRQLKPWNLRDNPYANQI